jgi:hypothetical protein
MLPLPIPQVVNAHPPTEHTLYLILFVATAGGW